MLALKVLSYSVKVASASPPEDERPLNRTSSSSHAKYDGLSHSYGVSSPSSPSHWQRFDVWANGRLTAR